MFKVLDHNAINVNDCIIKVIIVSPKSHGNPEAMKNVNRIESGTPIALCIS